MFKPIVFGVLFGAAAFFVPFLIIKVFFFFMVMGLVFRLFWWRGRKHHLHYRFAYADKIRNMSDEEYAAFKNNAGHCYHHHCGDKTPNGSKK
jgi:hypothetical protein